MMSQNRKTSTQSHLTLVEVTRHLWDILIAFLYRFLTCVSAPQLGTGEPEAKVRDRLTNKQLFSSSRLLMLYAYMLSQLERLNPST